MQKVNSLASLCSCVDRFESYLVANPEHIFFSGPPPPTWKITKYSVS